MKKLLLIFLLIPIAYSLGIAPAKTEINYFEGTYEGSFRILNEEPSNIIITTSGLDIEVQKEVKTNTYETTIPYKINLKNLKPGENIGKIIIIQENNNPGTIIGYQGLIHKIIVNVPYPGKYLEGKLYINNGQFIISLINKGNQKINNCYAEIKIKEQNENIIDKFSTLPIIIDSQEEKKIITEWQNKKTGKYEVEILVYYDDKILEFNQEFEINTPEISIEDIKINNFKLGQIAKIDITLKNHWNSDIDTNGKIEIFKKNQLISSISAFPTKIPKNSIGIMNAYWNTQDFLPDNYDFIVNITYLGKSQQKTFQATISQDSVSFQRISGNIVKINYQTSILIILLIIVNIILFIYVWKKTRFLKK